MQELLGIYLTTSLWEKEVLTLNCSKLLSTSSNIKSDRDPLKGDPAVFSWNDMLEFLVLKETKL